MIRQVTTCDYCGCEIDKSQSEDVGARVEGYLSGVEFQTQCSNTKFKLFTGTDFCNEICFWRKVHKEASSHIQTVSQ